MTSPIQKNILYTVLDHNSMWGWTKTNTIVEDADVVFVWNDFTMEEDVKRWQTHNKKVICFEHGWNAFFDYKLNHQRIVADGYMALGVNSAKSLIKAGVSEDRILITGNPNFENLKTIEKTDPIPSIIYTALHWFGARGEYNTQKLNKIIKTFERYAYVSVKSIDDSYINIPKGVHSIWHSEVSNQNNLFRDLALGLSEYDIILTPKESSFDFVALLLEKKVFRIGREEEYREAQEPLSRHILPYVDISTDLLLQKPHINVNLKDELSPSLTIGKILKWVQKIYG